MPDMGPMRVLVADGYRDSADSLAVILALRGFDARTVYDGHSAAATLESWKPDAAIIDLDFDDRPGLEVGREARRRAPGMTLIGITGWPVLRHGAMATSSGFDYVQMKPTDYRRLINMILDRSEVQA